LPRRSPSREAWVERGKRKECCSLILGIPRPARHKRLKERGPPGGKRERKGTISLESSVAERTGGGAGRPEGVGTSFKRKPLIAGKKGNCSGGKKIGNKRDNRRGRPAHNQGPASGNVVFNGELVPIGAGGKKKGQLPSQGKEIAGKGEGKEAPGKSPEQGLIISRRGQRGRQPE